MDVKTQPEAVVASYLKTLLLDEGATETVAPQAARITAPVAPVHVRTTAAAPPPITLPAWAQRAFPCLMWEATGVRLALPLPEMLAVVPASAALRPTAAALPWVVGEITHLGRCVRVVDMAAWIWGRAAAPAVTHEATRIAVLGGGDWALICPGSDVQQLYSADVRWRSAETRRRWLAGTVAAPRCALVDVAALVQLLVAGRPG